jgi:hypothetical protein
MQIDASLRVFRIYLAETAIHAGPPAIHHSTIHTTTAPGE